MKRLFVLLLLMGLGLNLVAKPVNLEIAKQFGVIFMTSKNNSASLSLAHVEKTAEGVDAFYVFDCQPKGFVIVAADDRMKPILGYSTESSFDLVTAEEGPKVFFDAYRSDLETAIEQKMEPSPEIRELWLNLEHTGHLNTRGNRTVGPLCTSTWHQTQLYNDQCPEDPEGYNGHVKSGCVANAMAQIMRYWEWPKSGVGSHSYYCYGYGSTSYGTLSANFGEADYRYELMPDFLDYTSPQYQVDAVALLEYHAGVSVEMDYGPNASGAYSPDAIDAMMQYFKYSNSTSFVDRDYYSDYQWIELMKNEVDYGRPMYYSAYSYTKDGTRGGHAFVCDGYDENDFFHFNWGWQGFDNGFYSINAMNLTHHAYNYSHRTTINMEPNNDYYEQPMPVSDVRIGLVAMGTGVFCSFTAPTQTIGGDALTSIDSIVLLANGSVFQVFENPQPGEELSFEGFFNTDPGNMVCFEVYPVTSGGRGKAVIENEAWLNSSKPITFQLHDAAGDGWLSPAISVMDQQGVMYRVGLDEGYEGTVTVNVPFLESITFFWNYCNLGYEDDDEECSFEVYDYKGDLIYAQMEKPMVGELYTFFNDLDYETPPDYITAHYEYLDDGRFGAHISWALENPNQWFFGFVLFRYRDLGDVPDLIFLDDNVMDYFDEVDAGTYYYRVSALYATGGGAPDPSSYASNLEDPSLDYAMVEVTSVEEIHEAIWTYVRVYNAAGQQVYEGSTTAFDSSMLSSGVYVLRLFTKDGKTITKKIVR